MTTNELKRMIDTIEREHGQLEVLCGMSSIGGLAVLPGPDPRRRVVSIIIRTRGWSLDSAAPER